MHIYTEMFHVFIMKYLMYSYIYIDLMHSYICVKLGCVAVCCSITGDVLQGVAVCCRVL